MKKALFRGLFGAALALCLMEPAAAEGLRVSPVTLDIPAPGAAAVLTLRNEGREAITIQTRSFLWQQSGGQETLQRSRDVVVSPPSVRLAPGASQAIRVVRVKKSAVKGEEAYRIVINEVPDQSRRRAGAVSFATEMRIPVFFTARGARTPEIAWGLSNSGNATYLVARNKGDTRLRLADLDLTGASGAKVRQNGLFGYVLGGSEMRWPVAPAGRFGNGAKLKAKTNLGTLDARVSGR